MDRIETEDRVDGIEAQAVESIVAQPHQRIVDDEAAHRIAVRPVVVDGRAPVGLIAIGEIRSVPRQIISIRPQVVVDHIQQHADTPCMTSLHEGDELLRRAVGGKRRVQIDAVISPPLPARKRRHRHEFHVSDAEFTHVLKLRLGRRVRPLGGESPDVHFVYDRVAQRFRRKTRRG